MKQCCEPYVCTSHAQVSACLKMKKKKERKRENKEIWLVCSHMLYTVGAHIHRTFQVTLMLPIIIIIECFSMCTELLNCYEYVNIL